jgi:hypothetical protein
MNISKLKSRLDGQTSIAKKVYECVPAQEFWTAGQICEELGRKGQTPQKRIVEGCLSTLKESGLVVEQGPGQFKAIVLKKKPTLEAVPFAAFTYGSEEEVEVNTVKIVEKKPIVKRTPLEILSGLATKLDCMMDEMDDLKKEIEDAALEITEQMQADDDKIKQLRQLQTLLKNLGE